MCYNESMSKQEQEVTNNFPEIVPDGVRYKELKNGAIYDLERGRIVANPGGGKTAITQARSSEYHKLRQEKRRSAVSDGMREYKKTFKSEFDAVKAIAKSQTQLAMSVKAGHASTQAAKWLMQAGDFVPEKGTGGNNTGQNTLSLSDNVAARLIKALTGGDNG